MVARILEGTEEDRVQMMKECIGRVFDIFSKRGYENRGVFVPDRTDSSKYNVCNGVADSSISLMKVESFDLLHRRIQIA